MSFFKKISPQALYALTINGLFEFGPIILFLIAYDYFHIYKATLVLMIATILVTVVTFTKERRLPYASLYIALLTSIFGYLTLAHRNPEFIQIRDTVYDVVNAVVVLSALRFNVILFKIAFDKVFPMTDTAWIKLSYLWGGFFIVAALVNEYIRNFESFHVWIAYKSSMIGISIVFGFLAMFYVYEKKNNS
jgi:intracellular septation protein